MLSSQWWRLWLPLLLLNSSCATALKYVSTVRPECLVLSICSVTTLQIAVFKPDLTDPQRQVTKGPGHALAQMSPDIKMKDGEACTRMVLGTFSWGDATIRTAAKRAKVENIATVDYTTFNVLGIVYSEFCTRVSGV